MGFRLPNGSDLSFEQLDIINLPTDKSWVIEGAPGTGKTVMAIYRAGQIARNQRVLLLVYNRPLMKFLSTAIKGEYFKNCLVATYHQWLTELYYRWFNATTYPQISPYKPDWTRVARDCERLGKLYEHVIIDEAQDFPIELIRILKKLSNNMTCFIDPNQALEVGKTDNKYALKELCIEAPYKLTTNFRNTKQIRDVSALYCQKGLPALSDTYGKKPIMVECDDYDMQTRVMGKIIKQNAEKSIGVIVNHKNLNATYEALTSYLDGYVDVQMYKTMTPHAVDFDKPGVKIVSYGTMKGLEFDIVFLPRFEKVKSTNDYVTDLNRIYVATSRPIEELYLFYFDTRNTSGWIDTFEPVLNNTDLFDWRRGV